MSGIVRCRGIHGGLPPSDAELIVRQHMVGRQCTILDMVAAVQHAFESGRRAGQGLDLLLVDAQAKDESR